MELTDLKGVGGVTAERLKEAGVDDLDSLAQSTQDDLTDAGMSESKASKLIRRAKRNTVVVQSGSEVVDEYDSKANIPTGMDLFDDVLDGGWREGDVVAVSGESGAGKTQICYQAMVTAVEDTGKDVVYIETERNRYSPKRLRSLSTDEDTQDKIHRVKAYDLEQQELAYDKIRTHFEDCALVVIDSFTARFRLSDDFDGRSKLQDRSKIIGRHLTRIEKMAEELGVPVLMTAQIYGNPSGYGGNGTYGGSLFQHSVNYFVDMSNAQGSFSKATIKNHYEVADTEIFLNIKGDEIQTSKDV